MLNLSQLIQLDPSIAGCFVAIIGFVIWFHIRKFTYWSSRGINGPTPWPILGTNIYYILGNKLHTDTEWHEKYGPTFGIYDGYKPALRTIDNELLKIIYIKEFRNFGDRQFDRIHTERQRNWIFWTPVDVWANQRALASPLFTGSKLASQFNTMSSCIDRFIKETKSGILSTCANLNGKESFKGQPEISLSKKEFAMVPLDIIAATFFSMDLNVYREKASEYLKGAYESSKVYISRLIIYMLTPSWLAKLFEFDLLSYEQLKYFDQVSDRLIKERRRNNIRRNDLIQGLLDAKMSDKTRTDSADQDKGLDLHYNDKMPEKQLEQMTRKQMTTGKMFERFSDENIRDQMVFFFFAGYETTSTLISFCAYVLAHEQKIQTELCEELEKHVCDGQKLSNELLNKNLTPTKLGDLDKLGMFVSEVLRLYPPAFENSRVVTAPDGFTLPTNPPIKLSRGTEIFNSLYALHRLPQYFDRPHQFDMTRFDRNNKDNIKSCTYAPFGLGPRYCAGMRFALLETKLFLAKLIASYKIMPGHESQPYPIERFSKHQFFTQADNHSVRLIPVESN